MIQLRPLEEKDAAFIEAVYRTAREAELNLTNWSEYQKNAFISMQSTAQHAEYKTKFPNVRFQVITFNKKMLDVFIQRRMKTRSDCWILHYCQNSEAKESEKRFYSN